MRPRLAALLLAVLAVGTRLPEARAQAGGAFEVMPRSAAPQQVAPPCAAHRHRRRGLIAGSFPLAHEADRRYADYLAETDVTQIDAR